jgi:D-arabinose 1-dehydrogenase-like Zn-dependent alcohol dehydrogenase
MPSVRSVVLEAFGQPVQIRAVPAAPAAPGAPEPGTVVASVKYGGVCGTDVHLQAGRLPIPLPLVLGHEGVGRVAELGEGVERDALGHPLALGDRIGKAVLAP